VISTSSSFVRRKSRNEKLFFMTRMNVESKNHNEGGIKSIMSITESAAFGWVWCSFCWAFDFWTRAVLVNKRIKEHK
jgi:hypothetical protein